MQLNIFENFLCLNSGLCLVFLASALGGGKWSASHSVCFTPGESSRRTPKPVFMSQKREKSPLSPQDTISYALSLHLPLTTDPLHTFCTTILLLPISVCF